MNRNEDMYKSFQSAIEEHKTELIVLLQNLIKRPSDTSEKECQQFIESWLKERGMDCDVWNLDVASLKKHNAWVETNLDYTDRPNLVSVYKGKGGGKSLSLLSRIDVVPIEEPEAWIEKDPWSGAIVEDKIYGRGSLDMKAGVAIGLYLLGLLKKLGIELKGDVIFQSVIDEENGGEWNFGGN